MLDHSLIHRRRTELGLSQRALAAQINSTGSFVRNLESGGNTRDLSLVQVARLADALALDITEILQSRPDEAPAGPGTGGDDRGEHGGDPAAVGALLHAAGVLTPIAALAEVLDWSYERLEAALDELHELLRPCGMRLHRLHHRVAIERDTSSVSAEVLEASVRRHLARDNLNVTEARMLHRPLTGRGLPRDPSNADNVAIAVLVNAGLVKAAEREGPAGWELAADVAAGLLLDG